MEQLLTTLKTIPEFGQLLLSLSKNESAAVTGIGQINRSHMIAGLHQQLSRPIVIVCQDDMAAKRLQEELKAFLGETAPILPNRELTLYDAAVVSRAWEQKRLRQFYDLAGGRTGLQILTWESLSQRTMPRSTLMKAAFRLETGKEYPLDWLLNQLSAFGYSRWKVPASLLFAAALWISFLLPPTGRSVPNSSATSWIPWVTLTRIPSAGLTTLRN